MKIFDTKVRPKYVYQQYRSEQWLIDFFSFLDEYIQVNYYDKIDSYIEARDILHSNSDYLAFYTRYLLGIYKPLGSASISNYYDIGYVYDKGEPDVDSSVPSSESNLIYDDAALYDGTISQDQFITYLRFVCNYEYDICNLDYVCNFVAAWCGIKIEQIKIELGDKSVNELVPGPKIKITLPLSIATQDFVKLTFNYGDVMGWPKGVDLDFRVDTTTAS